MSLKTAFAALTLALALPAQAVQLPDDPSKPLILNFDFTAASPAPPFSAFEMHSRYGTTGATSDIVWTFYDGLNGTGSFDRRTFPDSYYSSAGYIAFSASGWIANMQDGSFSIGLYDPTGKASMTEFSVVAAMYGPNQQRTTAITYALAPVPEPTSAALLLAGLAGLAWRRRALRG